MAARTASRTIPGLEKAAREVYRTRLGAAVHTAAEAYLPAMVADSVDLVVTSPPFALLREKAYGNRAQAEYEDWLLSYGPLVRRVLKDTGSFVLELGGAYQRGLPVRSLYQFRVLLRFCDECGFHLAQEFYWHNTAKLPSPIEWVNKRKIRVKDAVSTIWWLSKTPNPKASVRSVLAPYSARMNRLLSDPGKHLQPKLRPSGHDIGKSFAIDNGGAIPPNLLAFPNTESNSLYLRLCKRVGAVAHPARFPMALPEFFIRFLTEPGDLVLDIFAGSNTTGAAAEKLGRRWLALESSPSYAASSGLRFLEGWPEAAVAQYLRSAESASGLPIELAAAVAA